MFEWQARPPSSSSAARPVGGAGAFDATRATSRFPILDVAGTHEPLGRRRLRSRLRGPLRLSRAGHDYAFSLDARAATPLLMPRTDAAGAPLGLPGVALVAGGRDAGGSVLASIEIYVAYVDRSFRLPAGIVSWSARAGAGATLLPDGRIVIAGGRTSAGAPSAAIDILSF